MSNDEYHLFKVRDGKQKRPSRCYWEPRRPLCDYCQFLRARPFNQAPGRELMHDISDDFLIGHAGFECLTLNGLEVFV